MSSRRILYPVQFDAIEGAVTWQVAEVARAWRAGVVLLASRRRAGRLDPRREPREEVARRLSGVGARLRGYVVEVRIADEPLAEAALAAAQQFRPDVVMIGAGARAAKAPSYVGAAALELARRAPQDVWICKPFADPRIEHVLCSAEINGAAAAAVQCSLDLCRRFNARLRLVSVLPEPHGPHAGSDPEMEVELRRRELKQFLERFDLRGVALSRSVVWDRDASAELVEEARQFWDGLLVVGATPHGSRCGWLGDGVEAVLRGCPSSLLLVRNPALRVGAATVPLKATQPAAGVGIA